MDKNHQHISQLENNPFSLIKQKQTSAPETIVQPTNPSSISGWIQLYYLLIVKAQTKKTQQAKQQDLKKFLKFYREFTKSDNIKYWIAPTTKEFQEHLQQQISLISQQPYQATTINRIFATIRHFANWLVSRYPLPDGNPTLAIKDLVINDPEWKGLTNEEIAAMKKACQDRLDNPESNRQNPMLEAAVFYCLLYTGLRESELININRNQYKDGGFHNVKRKNRRITRFVPLPPQAAAFLDNYLVTITPAPGDPLFISKKKCRLSTVGVFYICKRLASHAKQYLPSSQKLHVSPHQLRHTFLKRAADLHGIHYAQQISGNSSVREIFRYARPSQEEINKTVETFFKTNF